MALTLFLLAGEAEGTCISDVTSKPLGIPADENKDLDITYSYTVTFKVIFNYFYKEVGTTNVLPKTVKKSNSRPAQISVTLLSSGVTGTVINTSLNRYRYRY